MENSVPSCVQTYTEEREKGGEGGGGGREGERAPKTAMPPFSAQCTIG